MIADTNSILRAYLASQSSVTNVVSTRIYVPRLPEGATLPAVGLFERSGLSNPNYPDIVESSMQLDCWADDPIEAREVYGGVFDALQGIQNQSVVVGGSTYLLMSAIEEVQGQDLADPDIQNYFRVLTFFKTLIRAVTI